MLEQQEYELFHTRSRFEKSLNTLKGLIQGITIDGVISDKEMNELINWCSLQAEFQHKQPYSELLPLIYDAISDGNISSEECQDILWVCNNFITENKYFDYITASIQQLHGIIHGVLADNQIDDAEIARLFNWVSINDFLRGTYPFDELYSILTAILSDHIITDYERLQLKSFLGEFIDTRDSFNINLSELEDLRSTLSITGICSVCPDIVFKDHLFCFTGESNRAKRKDIAKIIIERNGLFSENITSKTDYLIVGSSGSSCWAFSCYGRKVEKAVELRKSGSPIIIVHENDFWDAI